MTSDERLKLIKVFDRATCEDVSILARVADYSRYAVYGENFTRGVSDYLFDALRAFRSGSWDMGLSYLDSAGEFVATRKALKVAS